MARPGDLALPPSSTRTASRASTIWYHDHTLGMTRLNVYAGPAGFFIIRGGPDGDAAVLDTRTGTPAVLPGPAPKENDKFPSNKTYYEIPIAIQDRSFNTDGSLFYPDTRAFFDGITGPYIPDTDISPIWNPEFFGNMIMVNGNTWPFQTVEKRRYRFRFLNGCDARFLILDFSNIPGVEVWQIGNEGGFLAAPVNLTAVNGNQLLMGPAERADVIVDFTNVPVGNYVLGNIGPDEPFGGGVPASISRLPIRQPPARSCSSAWCRRWLPTRPPRRSSCSLPAITPLSAGDVTRPLALLEEMSMFFADAPAETLLGTVAGDPNLDGTWTPPCGWTRSPRTRRWAPPRCGSSTTPPPMPTPCTSTRCSSRSSTGRRSSWTRSTRRSRSYLDRYATPPEPWENGFKDTVIAYPGQVTRVRAQFNTPGQFVWHCHIVEHEDNEMMRPYRIGPEQPGQPMPHPHGGM